MAYQVKNCLMDAYTAEVEDEKNSEGEYEGTGVQDIHWTYLDPSTALWLATADHGAYAMNSQGISQSLNEMFRSSYVFDVEQAGGFYSTAFFYFPWKGQVGDGEDTLIETMIMRRQIGKEFFAESGQWDDHFRLLGEPAYSDTWHVQKPHMAPTVQITDADDTCACCWDEERFHTYELSWSDGGWVAATTVVEDDLDKLVRRESPNRQAHVPMQLDRLTDSVNQLRSTMETAI